LLGLTGAVPHLSANLVLKAAMRVEKRRPNKGLRRDATRELFRATRELFRASREFFLPEQGIVSAGAGNFFAARAYPKAESSRASKRAKLIHSSAVV
jgi:hypothetical protein